MTQSKIRPSSYVPVNFDMNMLQYMTQAEQEQALAYFEALTKIEAKDHLRVFAGRNGYTPAKHHQLIIDHLEALERREIQNLMVVISPGAGKSVYSSILFPAWYMGRNPKHMVLAASNTMELAERFGRKVRSLVAAPDFGEIFDGVGLSEESAAAARWETNKGSEYFAVGIGGSIVGRRGDILVLDDVVRSKEDVESEQLREKVWQWYVADVVTRLKPNAVKLFVNTRWHHDDLAGRILDREADKWTVLHMEMENTREDDPLGRAIGERLWPEWFTQEMVDEAKQDVGTWNALYQGRPSPDGGGEFKKDWVEYYDNPPDRKRVTTLMLVDPANSKTKKSDYTAIWVLGVGGDDNFYVLDMVRDRLDLAERIDVVFRLHRKWKPVETRYERFGLQTEIDYLKIEMDKRSYRFRIREVAGTRISKEDRIRRLIPYFKAGRIIFPREFMYTDHSGKPRDLVQYFIEDEMAPFPVGKKDDLIDSLSRLAEPGLVLPKHVTEEEKKEMFMLAETEFVPLDPVLGY